LAAFSTVCPATAGMYRVVNIPMVLALPADSGHAYPVATYLSTIAIDSQYLNGEYSSYQSETKCEMLDTCVIIQAQKYKLEGGRNATDF
jgi:hypothetical protein